MKQKQSEKLATIQVRDGLSLRLLQPGDAERMAEIFQADPLIQSFVTWTAGLKTVDEIRSKIERLRMKPGVRYSIIKDSSVIGYIGAWEYAGSFGDEPIPGQYDIGYFCDPLNRGKGIVSDAVRVLMARAQDVFAAKSFSLYIEDGNEPSKAVAQKLGFKATDVVVHEPKLDTMERKYVRVVSGE